MPLFQANVRITTEYSVFLEADTQDEAECWFDEATVDDIEIDGIEDAWAADIEVLRFRKIDIAPTNRIINVNKHIGD